MVYGQTVDDKETILIVDGHVVQYENIKILPESSNNISRVFGRGSSVDLSDPKIKGRLDNNAEKLEIDRLSMKVQDILQEEIIKYFNITVSEDEANDQADKTKKQMGEQFVAAAIRFQHEAEAALKAFKAMRDEKLSSDEAYDKYVSKFMPKNKWEMNYLDCYKTLEQQEKLAKLLEKPPAYQIDYKRQAKFDIIHKKLDEAIDKDIVEHYPALGERLAQVKKTGKTFVANDGEALRKWWWDEQYKKAKIEIKNDKYKPVLSKLGIVNNEAIPAPNSPAPKAPPPAPSDK